MFERFTKDARTVIEQADKEARALGAPALEAEHLLLACARKKAIPLDADAFAQALETEFEASLEGVGVRLASFGPPPVKPRTGHLRFGTSAKLSLERAAHSAVARRERRFGPEAIALGVLEAQVGTVPRALEALAVDPYTLAREVQATLG